MLIMLPQMQKNTVPDLYLGQAYQVNVTSFDAVSTAIEDIIHEFSGRLDIFIANSGISWIQGAIVSGELTHYHDVVTTDLDGTFYCARAVASHWRRQKKEQTTIDGKKLEPPFKQGSFVATASISGHIVNIPQLQAPYNAVKAGIIHLCMYCPSLIYFLYKYLRY